MFKPIVAATHEPLADGVSSEPLGEIGSVCTNPLATRSSNDGSVSVFGGIFWSSSKDMTNPSGDLKASFSFISEAVIESVLATSPRSLASTASSAALARSASGARLTAVRSASKFLFLNSIRSKCLHIKRPAERWIISSKRYGSQLESTRSFRSPISRTPSTSRESRSHAVRAVISITLMRNRGWLNGWQHHYRLLAGEDQLNSWSPRPTVIS